VLLVELRYSRMIENTLLGDVVVSAPSGIFLTTPSYDSLL
jgi:hypothetical protein